MRIRVLEKVVAKRKRFSPEKIGTKTCFMPEWPKDLLNLDLSSVAIFSRCAVTAAREYVALVEAQLSQARADMLFAALEEYRRIPNRDECDYDAYVTTVERNFDEDFLPALRFTEVVYIYMIVTFWR